MRIGELARRTGVSTRALRYYEQHGLLRAERAGNGYREFPEGAVVRVSNIRDLLGAGLTVEDIREPLAHGCLEEPLAQLPLCETALSTAASRLAVLDRRIATLLELRQRLAAQVRQTQEVLDRSVPAG
jgi:DNA-binding transcriptional MerR regulator